MGVSGGCTKRSFVFLNFLVLGMVFSIISFIIVLCIYVVLKLNLFKKKFLKRFSIDSFILYFLGLTIVSRDVFRFFFFRGRRGVRVVFFFVCGISFYGCISFASFCVWDDFTGSKRFV